jgi:arginine decarboxylase
MFELGILDLDVKAGRGAPLLADRRADPDGDGGLDERPPRGPDRTLRTELADQHICNFSVFQSLLDHWALGQLFPIVPIHRLDEAHEFESTLVDITCDSDGKVSKFIDLNDVRDTLPLHDPIRGGRPYYLGIFLTGAYQDIMGDIHNLFGTGQRGARLPR